MTAKSKIAVLIVLVMAMATAGVYAQTPAKSPSATPAADAQAASGQNPKAVFPESTYQFDTVFEGALLKHDFIVINQGKAPLKIERVRPDCGCSVASHPSAIAPGGKEKISVVVRTKNMSSGSLHKGFTVFTNDPENNRVRLAVTGRIKAYVDVSPRYVRFIGQDGQALKQTVRIVPLEGHPLSIKRVAVRGGKDHLRYELKPLGADARTSGYGLVVENTCRQTGRYTDLITLETDSEEKPSIIIPVYGNIVSSAD